MDILKGKVFKNASWIIGSKILQSVFAFVISTLSARYLGPSNYGLINYASSVVTFVIPFTLLGFNNTLVQELTQNPQAEGKILGTSIFLSSVSAIFCMIGVVSFATVANWGDKETVVIVAICSFNLLFQVLDLIRYWFQAKLLSKYSSIVSLVAYLIVSLYKLYLLIAQKSVYWFAASQAIDYFLIAVFLLILYRKVGGQALSVNVQFGKRMFLKSKHYIVPGLMVAIFSQTDKIMLKSMVGEKETGFYAAAVAIASITSFVYAAIIDSFRPIIFSVQEDEDQFELKLKRLYAIVIWLSLLQGLVMTLFSGLFVNVLYGTEFRKSADILSIVVWFVTFSYLGSIRNIWILAKNKQKYLWIINATGTFLNVLLNWLMIPQLGAVGAAITSVFTQMFTNFLLGFIITPIRENNVLLMQSLHPKIMCDLLKKK